MYSYLIIVSSTSCKLLVYCFCKNYVYSCAALVYTIIEYLQPVDYHSNYCLNCLFIIFVHTVYCTVHYSSPAVCNIMSG